MKAALKDTLVLAFWTVCQACLAAQAPADLQTPSRLRQETLEGASQQKQPEEADNKPPVDARDATGELSDCPSKVALDFFMHEIAFDRMEALDPLRGLHSIHVNVWHGHTITAFYVDDPTPTYTPESRLLYLVSREGTYGFSTCPVEEEWQKCAERSAAREGATDVVQTCSRMLDLDAIPEWEPSPNNEIKRRIADELREEIEDRWQDVQQIVIRDFNVKDRQVTMYLKLPDGDYYRGCGFIANSKPHCDGWHGFGNTPELSIRKWIFERPYPLR